MKKNACIFLISARKHLLHPCLQQLEVNYNNQHNYPVLIFYHGKKYDDEKFQATIRQINPNTDYYFYKIKAELPSNISEKDLFYNLNVPYVRDCFPPQRIGYLHANYFWNNFMEYHELSSFDYLMRIDDDSWFKKPFNIDPFEELSQSGKLCGSAYTWNDVSDRVLDTRVNFYKWIKDYVEKYNIKIEHPNLQKYLDEGENDIVAGRHCNKNFHQLKQLCGNCSLYKREMFQSSTWKQYMKEFNDIGGGYRYRWGDCEVHSLYYYLHIGENFLDLKLPEKDLYNKQLPKGVGFIHDSDL